MAAHVRRGTDGGSSLKPSDRWTFPCCDAHHREQHRIGEISFEAKYALDLKAIASMLAIMSPYLKQERQDP